MEAALQAFIAGAASFFFVSGLFALFYLCRRPTKPILPQHSLDRLSMSELSVATRNFSPDAIIGDGGFGFVYKALLPTGSTVAIKRLSSDAFHGLREFRAEMETLGRIRHPNLTRLLGYCASGRDRVLIYEFLSNGSLDCWLHDPSAGAGKGALPWPVRLRVARGAAAGLAFLHHECRPRIIHRDIKSSNVLLDAGFGARIADFGLARRVGSSRSHVSTQVAGTVGYMPPEYREGAAATMKGDVYSFGVLMLELVTGRRPNWPVSGGEGGEEPMVWWARRMAAEGRVAEAADVEMGEEGMVVEELRGFMAVACRCTEEVVKKRPDMEEVVSMLDKISQGVSL